MIKTVICDLGGVYFTDGSARAIERISAAYDIAADRVSDVLMGDLGSRYRFGEISVAEFWDGAKQDWNLQVPETEEPQRVDVRYAARMPETKMATLVNGLVDQTDRALQHGSYDHRVVLADGKREIWRIVDEHCVFEGFTRILDFYHAAQHLSMAAEHLFGKASVQADRWFRSWRHKLRHTPNAVAGLIRSVSYHRHKLRRRSQRYRQATTELGYFRNNRDKMDYARYHAWGLIISSGPVEAAAKTIVGHRLKRSGMRWTRQGGQQILNLRVQVQSKRWDAFWNWYLQQTTPITTLKRAA